MAPNERTVLTMNGGSSSLKFSLVAVGDPPRRLGSDTLASSDPRHAAAAVLDRLESEGQLRTIAAIGHRVVHGGELSGGPALLTPAVLEVLRKLVPVDPDHLPGELAIIEATIERVPAARQIACFDTTFHRTMPAVAKLLPLPREFRDLGLARFGFHGLSCAFLTEELERVAGPTAARGRVVIAHLGAGASLTAVRDGRSVETTMGFTPCSGIPMATRSGDLDPGVLIWLYRNRGLMIDAVDDLVNRRSGLLGVAGSTSDMRTLLEREPTDPDASLAIELFCYQARKAIGALTTTLGGIDTLIFSGGIGARSPVIRALICRGLDYLGISLHQDRNDRGEPIISPDDTGCVVRAMTTDEETILAREAIAALRETQGP